VRNDKFVEQFCANRSAHDLLGLMIARLDPLEARLLLHGTVHGAGSNVPQAILRDALCRVRIAAEEGVPQ
jgi:hypothetical protein